MGANPISMLNEWVQKQGQNQRVNWDFQEGRRGNLPLFRATASIDSVGSGSGEECSPTRTTAVISCP